MEAGNNIIVDGQDNVVPVAGNEGDRVEDGTTSTSLGLGGNDGGGCEHRAPDTRRTKGGDKRKRQLREETSKPRKSPRKRRPRKLD